MAALPPAASEHALRRATILILDDNAADREVLGRFLRSDPRRAYEVHVRSTIEDALHACGELQPDCVLLDYSLGDGTGIDFLEALASIGGTRRFPVVMLTGSGSEEIAAEAFKAGAQDYLVKGTYTSDVLQRAIAAAVYKAETERLLDQQRAELERLVATAQEANARKDQFLATLSHELRTPLTPILTAVSSLSPSSLSPEELEEVFAMIRRNVELEARLIDDLLDLTRIASGKLRLDSRPIDVHEALRHALDTCIEDIGAKNIRLTQDFQATARVMQGDPARLQQVFWNLLKNAVKFTPPGGEIRLATRNTREGALEVQVADSGCGIRPDALAKIFDAFEQGDPNVTHRFGGLGLGLAIAKALVDAHGGKVHAESPGLGGGAKFTVNFPVTIAEAAVVVAPAPGTYREREPSAGGASPMILLVEDHQDSARLLSAMMRRQGYRVVTAASVAEAIAAFEREEVQIVVSDIGLPDGDGVALMEQLRARRPVAGIALSGYGMDHDHARSHAAGFVEHITKPVNWSRLQGALARLAESEAALKVES